MNTERCKKILLILSIVTLLMFTQTATVLAANNQGLEWAVAQDDRFDYDVEVTYHNATYDLEFSDQMYVIIGDVPTIPDNISFLYEIAFYEFSLYWANDSSMDDFWMNVMSVIPFNVLPIGNWSLIAALYAESPASTIDDVTTFTATWGPNEFYNSTSIFMKTNGVLAYLLVEWNRTGMEDSLTIELIGEGFVPSTSTTSETTTLTGTLPSAIGPTSTEAVTTSSGPTGPITYDAPLLLFIGVAVVVVVIIIIVIIVRRR